MDGVLDHDLRGTKGTLSGIPKELLEFRQKHLKLNG